MTSYTIPDEFQIRLPSPAAYAQQRHLLPIKTQRKYLAAYIDLLYDLEDDCDSNDFTEPPDDDSFNAFITDGQTLAALIEINAYDFKQLIAALRPIYPNLDAELDSYDITASKHEAILSKDNQTAGRATLTTLFGTTTLNITKHDEN